jgi:hypothetical protein
VKWLDFEGRGGTHFGHVANFGEKNQASENMICPTLRRGTTVFWGGFWGVFGKKWVRRGEMFNCE